jgi:hypothetical protein
VTLNNRALPFLSFYPGEVRSERKVSGAGIFRYYAGISSEGIKKERNHLSHVTLFEKGSQKKIFPLSNLEYF